MERRWGGGEKERSRKRGVELHEEKRTRGGKEETRGGEEVRVPPTTRTRRKATGEQRGTVEDLEGGRGRVMGHPLTDVLVAAAVLAHFAVGVQFLEPLANLLKLRRVRRRLGAQGTDKEVQNKSVCAIGIRSDDRPRLASRSSSS